MLEKCLNDPGAFGDVATSGDAIQQGRCDKQHSLSAITADPESDKDR